MSSKNINKKVLSGNHSVAYGVKLSKASVISAYPITPQTAIIEKLSEFVERGELKARIIKVESEHSALAATFGAALGGARAFTATSSHGLLYMHEWLHWVSRSRIPVVMAIVTRTIGLPWNIWPDHSDYMDQRDTGWIMTFGMDNQEVLDLTLQAFKLSEDPDIYLPVIVGLEGFVLGGTYMPVLLPDEREAEDFVGERAQPYTIDPKNPIAIGNMTLPEGTEEMFMDMQKSMMNVYKKAKEIDSEYGKIFGRSYGGLTACYKCEDAKYMIVTMGAWSGDAIEAVNVLRSEGYPVGLLRVRYFRPMPTEDYKKYLFNSKMTIVFDRSISYGSTGSIYQDVISSLHLASSKINVVHNVIAGIGGVDMTLKDFYEIFRSFLKQYESGDESNKVVWYHKGVMNNFSFE
ncbi:MAG: pyruvate ferredoxin oxidoreductase [Fervidicoccus sp.]